MIDYLSEMVHCFVSTAHHTSAGKGFIMTSPTFAPSQNINSSFNARDKRCRIRWKIIATGYTARGRWLHLTEHPMLQSAVADMNQRYVGEKTHWIEYE